MNENHTQETIYLKNFSRYPSGRYRQDGDFSGEQYREEILEPLVQLHRTITVDMSSVFAVAGSFLDEAFGPFANKMGEEKFWQTFNIVVEDDPDLIDELKDIVYRRANQ